jgi:glyoxylase-like metal-dependent hydrolase (beta-lactamase superfamily II)
MNTFSYGAFASPHGGPGGPPSFLTCKSISVVEIELWAVEAFCHTPDIACLFFVASVVYVGDASV